MPPKKKKNAMRKPIKRPVTNTKRSGNALYYWIETNNRLNDQAKQDFTNTDYALKRHDKVHTQKLMMLKKTKFSDFYKPSTEQQGQPVFLGGGLVAVSYVAWKSLL